MARDAGPREGAIRLPPEKPEEEQSAITEEDSVSPLILPDEDQSPGIVGSLRRKVSQRFSGYFAQRSDDGYAGSSPQAVPLASAVPRPRASSRTSRADGSAYGYSGSYRRRLTSTATLGNRRGSNASSMRRRRGSNGEGPQSFVDTGDLNFAQRLLMANENAVTNIADLWVAAAMNADNEDPFETDTEGEDADSLDSDDDEAAMDDLPATPTRPGRNSASRLVSESRRPSLNKRPSSTFGPRFGGSPRRPSASQAPATSGFRHISSSFSAGVDGSPRRASGAVPAIFAHPGVRTPPAVLDAQQMHTVRPEEVATGGDTLAPIIEGQRVSEPHSPASASENLLEKPPSLTSQLPILIIIQYGLLALHSTTHDQVFLSYLVS